MTNVANWVEEATTDGGTSQAITLTGAAFANAATFAQAFGAAPVDVYYSIENGDNSEAGVGNFNGTTGLSRDTVQATHVSGVYDDTSPARINLVGDSIVRCALNAGAFGAVQALAESALQAADVDDTPVDAATTAPISSNWAYDHVNQANIHRDWTADQGGTNLNNANIIDLSTSNFDADVQSMFGVVDSLAFQKLSMVIVNDVGLQLDIEAEGTGDAYFVIEGIKSTLDCTTGGGVGGKARVALVEGADVNTPAVNYIYITDVAGTATLNTSGTLPTGAFAWVGLATVPDATTWAASGAYVFQRFTEAFVNDSRGTASHEREKLRALGALYATGVTHTLNITTNPGGLDNVHLAAASGTIYQLHRQSFPAFSTGPYYFGNGTGIYAEFLDLNEVLSTVDGTAFSDNTRFNLIVWGVVNITTSECKLFVNKPTGVYSTDSLAIADANNTADYSVPTGFRTVSFLISRLVLRYDTQNNGTWTELGVFSLLGTPVGVRSGGSGAVASTEFVDSQFRIFDNLDSTKQTAFEVSPIASGTTRTVTVPDADVDLAKVNSATQPADNNSTLTNDSAFIAAAGVTYENLDANGDVGASAGQCAIGNHLHTGVYGSVLYIDVTQPPYNADNTGATGASTAIQAAVDSLQDNNKGGVIFFPQGKYDIDAEILVIGDNITFMGVSSWATVPQTLVDVTVGSVLFTTRTIGKMINNTPAAGNAGLSLLKIQLQGPDRHHDTDGLFVDGVNGFLYRINIVECVISHCRYGVYCDGSANGTGGLYISNSTIGLNSWGIGNTGALNHVSISGCALRQNGTNVEGTDYSDDNTGGGLSLGPVNGASITGTNFEGQTIGIKIESADGVTISGCYFEGMASCAIYASNCRALSIDSCYLADDASRSKIIFLNLCEDSRIKNNRTSSVVRMHSCANIDTDMRTVQYAIDYTFTDEDHGVLWYDQRQLTGRQDRSYKNEMTALVPIDATYDLSTDILGPRGGVDNVYVLVVSANNGYLHLNLPTVNVIDGDSTIASAWVYIPSSNAGTNLYYEFRDQIDGGAWSFKGHTLTELPVDKWFLLKAINKSHQAETLALSVRLRIPLSGDKFYIYGAYLATYKNDTLNPEETNDLVHLLADELAETRVSAVEYESKETLFTACPETRAEQIGVTGAQTADMADGQFHYVVASASTLTLTFANTASIAAGADSLLLFLWPSAFTIAWAANTIWTDGSAPDLSVDTGHIISVMRRNTTDDEWAATYIGTTAITEPT